MSQFEGLTITQRGRVLVIALVWLAVTATFYVLIVHVQNDMCAEAQGTGTQWRIDRVCEPEGSK